MQNHTKLDERNYPPQPDEYIHVIPAEPNLFATVVWASPGSEQDEKCHDTFAEQVRIVGWGLCKNGITYPIMFGIFDEDMDVREVLVPLQKPGEFSDETGDVGTVDLARKRMAIKAKKR